MVARLREIASQNPELTLHEPFRKNNEYIDAEIRLDLRGIPRAEGGLPLEATEQFVIHIPAEPYRPPITTVRHGRFLGYPHVLGGNTLCLYLDPSREWDLSQGMTGHLNQLWRWLTEAASNAFDANTALYHAVGGYTHVDPETPVIVVRADVPTTRRVQQGYLVFSEGRRADYSAGTSDAVTHAVMPTYLLRDDLPFGAGTERLSHLLARLDHADTQQVPVSLAKAPEQRHHLRLISRSADAIMERDTCQQMRHNGSQFWDPAPAPQMAAPTTGNGLLAALAAAASRQPDGSAQYALLGVPHPTGGPHHLLALRLPARAADALRNAVATRRTPAINIKTSDVADDVDMEWCYVSDERPETTVRRDDTRPVHVLRGANVHIWGCGGIGSWIAEFIVRAGASEVTVCDPGMVTGGLLVRQNYAERDVAENKAESLAARLDSISDRTRVNAFTGGLPETAEKAVNEADLIIDATVNHTIGLLVDSLAMTEGRLATIAKVATDVRTGTLGLAVVTTPGGPTLTEIDIAAGNVVTNDPALEDYRVFWDEPLPGDELTPTRGCSAPTFHGSAADMAAVAGTLLNLVAASHESKQDGTHLFALPHAGITPSHRHVTHQG